MNKKDKENKKKDNSTITFGRLLEVMQEESDLQRKKRGLPPEKIEPLISEKPETKIKMPNVKEPDELENNKEPKTFGDLEDLFKGLRNARRKKQGLPPDNRDVLVVKKEPSTEIITPLSESNLKKAYRQQRVRRFLKNVIALVIVFILIAILVNTT